MFSQPIFSSKHGLKVGIVYFRSANLGELIDVFEITSKRLGIDFKMVKISAGEYDNRRALKEI